MSSAWLLLLCACDGGTPDPRTIEGAITAMAESIEHEDAAKMFRLIDPRSRHAMASIVSDRRKARDLVESSYPPEARAEALASLGDAAEVPDAAALFAKRCPATCLREIGAKLGAPTATRLEHGDTVVTTPRGELRLRGGGADWYGLVFRTEALADERERANRDLALITENAETYRRRRTLAQ
jgi:hypothetical protein